MARRVAVNGLVAPILTLPQVAQLAGGDLVVREVPAEPSAREAWLRSGIGGASIDTRTLQTGDLFVPLRGANADGHRFLAEAFARGAAAALCERSAYPGWEGREPGPLVLVDDSTAALQRLARRHRESWHGLLIGVTGSAGKTTTKDLVTAVLATAGPALGTEGNLNNQWGVPLTLLRIRPDHRAAVIEMAMNAAGEIAALAAIAEPNAAVITNAGSAHLGGRGLGTLAAIAAEKASLGFALPPGAPLFACAESPRLIAALAGVRARLVTYGFARSAALHPERLEDRGEAGTRLHVSGFPPVTLAIPGRHQALNALSALAVAREWRVDPHAAAAAIAAYRPGRGRMQVRHARGATLLVDHYNANPDSVRAALETLAGLPARRRIAVLGDMLELGPESARLHRETGATARDAELWVVGAHAEDWTAGARQAGITTRVFADKPALAKALDQVLGPEVAVLIKGSRGAALEDVLAALGVEA
jgi:UDP-N-acetylmuramoyl-tripeptide--D-alanyl-D-alanine ligase